LPGGVVDHRLATSQSRNSKHISCSPRTESRSVRGQKGRWDRHRPTRLKSPDKKGRESIGRPGRERGRLDDPLMLRPRTIATPRRTASAPCVRSWQQSSGDDHAIACASEGLRLPVEASCRSIAGGRPDLTWRTVTPAQAVWDKILAASHTGALTEVFRTRYASARSIHLGRRNRGA
jgi:hypothetical protein